MFTSNRERWLWLATAAAVVAIYSTLGVAGSLANVLRDRGLLSVTIVVVVAVALSPVAWRWVRSAPDRHEWAVVIGVGFCSWMVAVRTTGWAERSHLIEYGVVAVIVHAALLERAGNGGVVPVPAAVAVVATTMLGILDETIQAFLPSRVFDVRDIFFNAVAAFLAVAARLALAPQNRPGWRVWFLWLSATAFGWGQGVYWGWRADGDPKMLAAVPDDLLGGYLGVVSGMLTVAVLQWLALRAHISAGARWIVAGSLAVCLAGVTTFGVGLFDPALGWILGTIMVGPTAGLLQWTLLLRQRLRRAGWWIVASTAGWLAGLPFGDITGPPGLGAVYGVATATALVGFLRRPAEVPLARG